jgi:hypothetical protein
VLRKGNIYTKQTSKALIFNTSQFRVGAKSVENQNTKQIFDWGRIKISKKKNIFNKADEKLNLFAPSLPLLRDKFREQIELSL